MIKKELMKPGILLYFGLLAPFAFWTTTIICGLMIEDYNHFKWLVSELGALSTPTQELFTIGLVLSAILNIFFIVGLWKICRKHQLSLAPVLLLMLYSFIAGPAMFPMPLQWHGLSGLPFPLIILSPLVALVVWSKKEKLLKIRTTAIISFSIMLLGFLIFFPSILNEYFGLKQRFLYAGWTIWSVSLVISLLKVSKLKT
ncbi:MAG: hypothetical protein C0599_09920 [Salinivirgaceae bacterium]|nr:MAG: hypothetical protein C0599_09920 [Salinivirgaceae bacterium]